jgi:sulfite exporter TauE/SafE
MPDTGYLAVFLVGLLGGTHCVGMCGGIVGALTVQLPGSPPQWRLHLAYNTGRIAAYALAGAVLGALGGGLSLALETWLPVQLVLYLVANLMLVALGLYLTGSTWVLAFAERAGQRLWRRIQPLTRRFLPARSIAQAFPLGLLWGFLPCGMVYSVLTAALVAGSAWRGAALMLAFGLGTLPNLLLAGAMLVRLQDASRKRLVRVASGLVVLGFGVFGLINAANLGGRLWHGVLSHT